MSETVSAASDSAFLYLTEYWSSGSRAATRSPPITIVDDRMSAVDSTASATSAYA